MAAEADPYECKCLCCLHRQSWQHMMKNPQKQDQPYHWATVKAYYQLVQ